MVIFDGKCCSELTFEKIYLPQPSPLADGWYTSTRSLLLCTCVVCVGGCA